MKNWKRDRLDARAAELGIEDPEKLPTRAAVIEAIEEAERGGVNPDLFKTGARVISVFGPFGSRTMVELSTELASQLFREPLSESGRTNAIDAVEHDLAAIREVEPAIADSALAATALRMAYELENPFNSATSKSQCGKTLAECMDRLREQAPAAPKEDGVDDLAAEREARRAGKPAPPA